LKQENSRHEEWLKKHEGAAQDRPAGQEHAANDVEGVAR
jgi:hypothetical protein